MNVNGGMVLASAEKIKSSKKANPKCNRETSDIDSVLDRGIRGETFFNLAQFEHSKCMIEAPTGI